jgi:hypothetical protein
VRNLVILHSNREKGNAIAHKNMFLGARKYGGKPNESIIIFLIASGVGLSPLYCGHFWPIVPAPDDR